MMAFGQPGSISGTDLDNLMRTPVKHTQSLNTVYETRNKQTGYRQPNSVGLQNSPSQQNRPSVGPQTGFSNQNSASPKTGYSSQKNLGPQTSYSQPNRFGLSHQNNVSFKPMDSVGSEDMSFQPLSPTKADVEEDGDHDMTSTFYEFPKTRPFINTPNYRQSLTKPVIPYPESNRDGIYSAMKNLQDKVRRLELERTTAEDNLKNLSNETAKYSLCLQKSQETENLANEIVNKQTKEIENQLSAAETRCGMLEKQLDYMRKMLQTSQQEQLDAARRRLDQKEKDIHYPSHHHSVSPPRLDAQIQDQLRKIPELEREHLKLTATQSISENKIRELEEKLHEEDIHRKLIMDRANELQARAKAVYSNPGNSYNSLDELPIKLADKPKTKKIIKKKKKRTVTPNKAPIKSCSKHNNPSSHYRLNLAEIPFVAGTSTAPSHSVGANIQKVISMMKSHNLALCSSMYNGTRSGSVSSTSSTTSLDNDMTEILQQLQDEFGQLSFEHKELSNQIEETTDYIVKRDLRRELDRVVKRLETKSQQISKVRAHQQKLAELKKKVKSRKKENAVKRPLPQRPHSAHERTPNKPNLTKQTLNNKPSSPCSSGNVARNVLNDMRKIQTTLRKEDLKWE